MRNAIWLSAALALGAIAPIGVTHADSINYDMTQAGADSPSGIRPGELVSTLNTLVLDYNNGLSWNVTVGGDPLHVMDYTPAPSSVMLGELITHSDSSYVIYDRLAVRAVVQWIGYDTGSLPSSPTTIAYWTSDGLFNTSGLPWTDAGGGTSGGSGGGTPPQTSIVQVPEPSTLAITVIIGSAVVSLFRRKKYDSPDARN